MILSPNHVSGFKVWMSRGSIIMLFISTSGKLDARLDARSEESESTSLIAVFMAGVQGTGVLKNICDYFEDEPTIKIALFKIVYTFQSLSTIMNNHDYSSWIINSLHDINNKNTTLPL